MRFILLLLTFSFITVGFGQDLHLSQFYTNKMNLNPAFSGRYDGTYQFSGNYRNQWREAGTPLNTIFFSFDKHFFIHADELNVGILFNDDQFAGYNQRTNKFLLNASYTKRLGLNKLSAGIQMGVVLSSTDFSNQTFPNQWVYLNGEFDQNVQNGETNLSANQAYFDANMGLVWSRKFNNITPTVGFSVYHINKPKDTYNETYIERLRMRKVFFTEVDWRIKNNLSIEPKFLYMWTTNAQDLIVGTNLKKHLNSKIIHHIYAGVMMRTGFSRNIDAIFPTIGFNIDKFDVGFSYDINVSQLSQYNNSKSSLEWSVVYTFPMFNPKKLAIPCDRY
ncbi:hypothetical protein DNU06_08800 [Putridiphycobacter roseus]|uniref:Type IX secretion system membrane protein PorP/SprF n=1 Tax=Putridiphycobacter roseus TaxID=2219161 RepID=A0A2W1MYT4_9FLAO|nr:PorP/SprF family type IX secretion system membrane protein [Putridiphycobacter roseus]PZE17359.1 hypothetical protein DNU06_08800 [Putridiphycobacter roseus]